VIGYTMEVSQNGFVIRGPLPLDDMTAIVKLAKKNGFTQIDAGVAQALGSSFVITNAAGSKALRSAVNDANAGLSKEDRWLHGSDRGMSSETIFGIMTGKAVGEGSTPLDRDDFGRCYRLLELFPEWRHRLQEVAAKHPDWAGLVACWPDLTALFEAKKYRELYDVMKAARE
jgi:hypothetical protein